MKVSIDYPNANYICMNIMKALKKHDLDIDVELGVYYLKIKYPNTSYITKIDHIISIGRDQYHITRYNGEKIPNRYFYNDNVFVEEATGIILNDYSDILTMRLSGLV